MPAKSDHAPNFGIYHLNLDNAGMLIAKCLWFRGDLEVSFKRTDSVEFDNSELTAALNSQAVKFTNLLGRAVATGTLSAASVRFDLEERVQPTETFIDALLMAAWLESRDIALGEVFEDEYLAKEAELAERVSYLVSVERFNYGRLHCNNPENLFLRHELANLELKLAKANSTENKQASITEKQKSAYLNIIGALLGLLLGKSPSGSPYSLFKNQQAVIDGIHGNFGEAPGLSLRNLQDKLAQAKRMLNASTPRKS